MTTLLLKNGILISSLGRQTADLLIQDGLISKIAPTISHDGATEIDCSGKWILPGIIDTHVHFRDPGLTHKGDATTESKAAIAGGVTTICDMPNTNPQTLTIERVKEKQALYATKSLCNFGIYIGAARDNLEELKRADLDLTIPAIKIFMAESTGNMTLSHDAELAPIFGQTSKLIAVHAEDEDRRLERLAQFKRGVLTGGWEIEADDPYQHAVIRDNLVASQGTAHAISLAQEFGHRLHILHMSAAEELPHLEFSQLDYPGLVTGETCPHYLSFTREDIHAHAGYRIMNPSLKGANDRVALWSAIKSGLISQITTDHAPHLRSEKDLPYGQLPSGLPGVQFSLPLMLTAVAQKTITAEQLVALMCENPVRNYKIAHKGYLTEGFDADITIVDPRNTVTLSDDLVQSLCAWTPFHGTVVTGWVEQTIVRGELIYDQGKFVSAQKGKTIYCE